MNLRRSSAFNALFKNTTLALFDQALLSATNFLINVLLIRNVPAEEYGLFVLLNAALFLAIGLQNAIITTPLSVLAPKMRESEKALFIHSLAITQYYIWLPATFLVVAIATLADFLALFHLPVLVIVATAVAILLSFVREYMRRVFFVFMLTGYVLAVDVIYAASLLMMLALISILPSAQAAGALLSIGIAGALAGVFAIWLYSRWSPHGERLKTSLHYLVDAWKHGRWALMGVIVTWLGTQGFYYLLSGMKGRGDVADIAASQKLLMPISIMVVATLSILKPKGASLLAEGKQNVLVRLTTLFSAGSVAIAVVYTGAVYLAAETISLFVFKKNISGLQELVLLWGAVLLAQIIRSNMSNLLQIFEKFAALFYIGALATAATIGTAFYGIRFFDAKGSLIGLLTGEIVYIIAMGVFFIKRDISSAREQGRR